ASSRLKHSARPDSMSSPVSASITANFREELPQLRINTNLLMFYIFLCFGFMPTVSCHPTMDGIPLPGAYGRRKVRPIFQYVKCGSRRRCALDSSWVGVNPEGAAHPLSCRADGYRPTSKSLCTLTTSFFT